MFRDYKTFTRIHMNAFTLLHRNDLKSTDPFDLYQFIRIDTFRHDRYEFSQKSARNYSCPYLYIRPTDRPDPVSPAGYS